MNAANYGLITLIATETRSLTATAGAIVAFSLPALLIGAPAGVMVDRLDRRGVLARQQHPAWTRLARVRRIPAARPDGAAADLPADLLHLDGRPVLRSGGGRGDSETRQAQIADERAGALQYHLYDLAGAWSDHHRATYPADGAVVAAANFCNTQQRHSSC